MSFAVGVIVVLNVAVLSVNFVMLVRLRHVLRLVMSTHARFEGALAYTFHEDKR